jgi:hypothetical protein
MGDRATGRDRTAEHRRFPSRLPRTLSGMVAALALGAMLAGGAVAKTPPAAAAPVSVASKLASLRHQRACGDPVPGHFSCFAETEVGLIQPLVTANVVPYGYGPAAIQSAYALPPTAGSGRTVAIVEAFDLATAESDLATYRTQYALPACTTANGCFTKVDEYGGVSYPTADAGWAAETALDMDAVSAACPNCKILLVEASGSDAASLGQAVDTAVALGAVAVSNSYGGPATKDLSVYDQHYNHPGVAITVSSGDSGYGPEYPSTSPYVTAVGGTTLQLAPGTSRGWTESAWSGAGSGCGFSGPKPTWQKDTACATKSAADVSAVADPATGLAVYTATTISSGQSGWMVMGGTSAASPIIAGIYALAGTPTVNTYPASYAYANSGYLNDVTTGGNGTCPLPVLCTAGVGYDGPTGLGTPRGVGAFELVPPAPAPAPVPTLVPGDFSGDGYADVMARAANGGLYLYRGNGAGYWATPTVAQVGSGWEGMTALISPGDFNGDGHNDIIARDGSGRLWLYPGNGSSGWGVPQLIGSGWGVMASIIAAHDFTGDGHPDLLAVDYGGNLWLYPGNGVGGWLTAQRIGSGWNGMTALVGITNFSGDGNPAVMARDSGGNLWLYERGTSGWLNRDLVGSGWNPMSAILSVGDFSGDGSPDIIARSTDGALWLYPGNGHAGWGATRLIGSGWGVMNWIG